MESDSKLKRRKFLHFTLWSAFGLILASILKRFFNKQNNYSVIEINNFSTVGHQIQLPFNRAEYTFEKHHNTIVIGAGIGGLSAGYFLKKNKSKNADFIVLELSDKIGGNSKKCEFESYSFPFAAHYLPTPTVDNTTLIDFLVEHHICSFENKKLTFNPEFLCMEPAENLYIHGVTQNGLIPKTKLPEVDTNQINDFFKQIKQFALELDSKGNFRFSIPHNFNFDENAVLLEKISFQNWLTEKKFNSPYLLWYLNYCCMDDYGSPISKVSAYAGIHYFAARIDKNQTEKSILTSPGGNYFLTECLFKNYIEHIKTNCLVTKILKTNNEYYVYYINQKTQEKKYFTCVNLILDIPQYVRNKIYKIEPFANEFYPWLIGSIIIKKEFYNHYPEPYWDNVYYGHKGLGFIYGAHQRISQEPTNNVFTFYLNFSEQDGITERKNIYSKNKFQLAKVIFEYSQQFYPDIEKYIETIIINRIGHGMVSPGIEKMQKRRELKEKYSHENCYLVHSDISGISIFEEAFAAGNWAANSIVK